MASIFVILRKDFLDMLPGRNTDSHKQCAAALLNFFRNQREGWLTINIQQFQDILFDQWGKNTICKALEMLCSEGYIERKHHRMNGRAWQYRTVKAIKQMPKVEDPETLVREASRREDSKKELRYQATVEFEEELTAPDTQSVAPEEATSIYKDPLKDQQQDPAAAVKIDFLEKIQEIEQIEVTPKISVNFQVKEAIAKNPKNLDKAIAYVKEAVKSWQVRSEFNWAGLLVKAIKTGLEPVSPAAEIQKFTIPESPSFLEQWCRENNARQCIWSDFEKAFKIQMSDGSWIDASSIVGEV